MIRQLKIAILMTLVLTVATGLIYPLAVTLVARWVFPHQAGGSLVWRDERPIGSALIGQRFRDARYFHARPSAAGSDGYDPMASGGSNLGPTSARLIERVRRTAGELTRENPGTRVPVELVTTSGSGLDPDLSPAGAAFQIPRVARARGMPESDLRRFVDQHTKQRQLGLLGEPRVNVLELNLALDAANTQSAR